MSILILKQIQLYVILNKDIDECMDVWNNVGECPLFFSEENQLCKSGTFYNATLYNVRLLYPMLANFINKDILSHECHLFWPKKIPQIWNRPFIRFAKPQLKYDGKIFQNK